MQKHITVLALLVLVSAAVAGTGPEGKYALKPEVSRTSPVIRHDADFAGRAPSTRPPEPGGRDAWPYMFVWKFSTENIYCVGVTPVQDTLLWISSGGHSATADPNWVFIHDARSFARVDSFLQYNSYEWGYVDMCYDPVEDVVYAGTEGSTLHKIDASPPYALVAGYTVSGSGVPDYVMGLTLDGDSLYSCSFGDFGVVKFGIDGTNCHPVVPPPLPYAGIGLAYDATRSRVFMTTADYTGQVLWYDYPGWTLADSMFIPELGDIHGGGEMWLDDSFLVVLAQSDPTDSVVCLRVVPPADDVGVVEVRTPNGFVGQGPLAPVAVVRNFGTAQQRRVSVDLSIEPGGYLESERIRVLDPGDTIAVEFRSWTPPGTGVYTVSCSTRLVGDEVPENDRLGATAVAADFVQDFEATSGGMTPSGGWEWGEPQPPRPPASSGVNAWGARLDGEYPDYADWTLTSVSYVAVQDTPVCGFRHWYQTEFHYDGGQLAMSTDGGAAWQPLYPWTEHSAPYDDSVVALAGWGYSGTVPRDWDIALFRVPVDAGAGFLLRWRFASDYSVTAPGWVFDDLAGIGFSGVATDVGIEEIVAPRGLVPPGMLAPAARVRNYGTAAQGPFDVVMTITPGTYTSTQTVAALAPFDTVLVQFDDWTPPGSGLFECRCTTMLAGDEVPGNDARVGMAGIPVFLEDFEADDGQFTVDGSGPPGWAWGVPGAPRPEPPSPVKAWAGPLDGNYADNADWRLNSVRYVALVDTPIIAFQHWYDFETFYDGGNVKYSTDNGVTWSIVYPWEQFSLPYDTTISPWNVAIPDERGYTGGSYEWRPGWFRIPVTADQEFHLRWHWGTDASVNYYYGWMVDDVGGIGCDILVGIAEEEPAELHYGLAARPNPVPGRGRIDFTVARPGRVSLRLYDATGSRVATFADGRFEAGRYAVSLDASGLARGVYLLRMDADEYCVTRKVVIE